MTSIDDRDEAVLTTGQAYEAAFRFVAQYSEREPIEPFQVMRFSMLPVADDLRTADPATWHDWLQCVQQTVDEEPLPFP